MMRSFYRLFDISEVLTLVFLAVIVTAMLILGGAATVKALCGMNVYAASFLIPLSATPFTMHGEWKPS